jgi:hypothetical protein
MLIYQRQQVMFHVGLLKVMEVIRRRTMSSTLYRRHRRCRQHHRHRVTIVLQ